jgi:hypothetical protein
MATLRSFTSLFPTILAVVCLGGCIASSDSADEDERTSEHEEAVSSGSVGHAMQTSCTTGSVKGLSLQIIAEAKCINPDAYVKVPDPGNVTFGSTVFPYLEKPATSRLAGTLNDNKGKSMFVNSMLRTVAQQYLLHSWFKAGRCSIGLAATPGDSNHETGLAIDVSEWSSWKSALQNHGFKWLGSSDPVHFDYVGVGAKSHKGLDVRAFQRLWNRNHPGDKIATDGSWGPATAARMKKAPAAGFKIGALCNDSDKDGIVNSQDNCKLVKNPGQLDTDKDGKGDKCDGDDDGDGVKDAADNCRLAKNPGQLNTDGDGKGDKCDGDDDGDGRADAKDNCPLVANAGQLDTDNDDKGDNCDADDDGDGLADANDNCPKVKNPGQLDSNGDGKGDACALDDDADGVPDTDDVCAKVADPDQDDTDLDGKGDACDADDDADGVLDQNDNCPTVPNVAQADEDSDGIGDDCAMVQKSATCGSDEGDDDQDADAGEDPPCADEDDDSIPDVIDNCASVWNADQADVDEDGIGDLCTNSEDGDDLPVADGDGITPDEDSDEHFDDSVWTGVEDGASAAASCGTSAPSRRDASWPTLLLMVAVLTGAQWRRRRRSASPM